MKRTPINEMSESMIKDCSEPGETYNCKVIDLATYDPMNSDNAKSS